MSKTYLILLYRIACTHWPIQTRLRFWKRCCLAHGLPPIEYIPDRPSLLWACVLKAVHTGRWSRLDVFKSLPTSYLVFRNPFCDLYVIPSCQSITPCRFCTGGACALLPRGSLSPRPFASEASQIHRGVSLMSCFILHSLLSTVQPHGTRQHLQPGHHAHHWWGSGHLRHHLCQIQLARAEGKWMLSQPWNGVHTESLLCGNLQIIHR